ncbi:MAG: hypothetical protein ACQESC_04395 [Nanobdellota archaeon]
MSLTSKKEERLKKMPNIESVFFRSKDGKYLIHRTVITTVRPVEYFQKVLENEQQDTLDPISGEELAKAQAD